jgi:5-methylcytosine-specific restriction protein B
MKAYFLHCSNNEVNFNLCIEKSRAGFKQEIPIEGDQVFLLIKRNDGKTYCGAFGTLGIKTNDKPWPDKDSYKVAFEISWSTFTPFSINDGMKAIDIYWSGMVQSPKNIIGFNNKGTAFYDWISKTIKTIPQENYAKKESKELSMTYSILTAIKTKPFILLAGISGTGKSRLVRTLAYKTCSKEELRKDPKKPGNFELIPVRPNWHDSSELMGYVSRIGKNGEKYIITSYLRFIAKAWKHTDVPFFLCLDEMNLAPVEQYFAEYLSIIETRQIIEKKLVTDFIISKESFENHKLYNQLLIDLELDVLNFKEGISIPSNLIVIGTVNMDETTHSFSRKVLDRAMTFEMNNVDLTAGLDLNKEDWDYPKSDDEYFKSDDIIGKFTSGYEVYSLDFKEKDEIINFLKKINNELEGTPFKIAFRVRDEFLIYCYYASLKPTNDWLTIALDEMTCMKILSRIEGDETKTGDVIEKLLKLLDLTYPKSNNKLNEMKNKLQFGYTSFWS